MYAISNQMYGDLAEPIQWCWSKGGNMAMGLVIVLVRVLVHVGEGGAGVDGGVGWRWDS